MTPINGYGIIDVAKGGIIVRANIKISLWVPIVFLAIMTAFIVIDFDVLDVVIILGVLVIVVYFIMGYIKRKDALVIEGNLLKVTTPIKTKEFDLSALKSLSLEDNGTILRGQYQDEIIKVITNIYDVSLSDIQHYLLEHYPHINNTNQKGPLS